MTGSSLSADFPTTPGAFDRMLTDTYEPLAQLKPAGFSPGVLARFGRPTALR